MKSLLILILALPLCGQSARYHHGDDPRWADPNFDDSAWAVVQKDAFPPPPTPGDGIVWVRQRVTTPAGEAALWLRLTTRLSWIPNVPEELRVDGRVVGSSGRLPPDPSVDCAVYEKVFDVPAGVRVREVLVARRIWIPSGIRGTSVPLPAIEIGPRDATRLAALRARDSSLRDNLLLILPVVFQMIVGIGLLIAWHRTRATADIFWFAVLVTFWNAWDAVWYLTAFVWPELSFGHYTVLNSVLSGITFVSFWCFTGAILSLPARWPLYVLAGYEFAASLARGYVVAATTRFVWFDYATVTTGYFRLELAAAVLLLALALWHWPRGLEQRLIVSAFLVFRFILVLTDLSWISPTWSVAGFSLDVTDNCATVLFLTMAWVLFRRVWRTWVERQGLSSEFEAAREMQEALVQRALVLAGFAVESAYLPASQVGGDFYRILPADDGAVLVVVGDVSGKGLKAAMTVAGLVCAMEAIRTRRPGLFLEELNHAAKGYMQSGFATCCAALIQRSGEATIANAGHLAPYADGRELEVEAGLPLGIADGVEYPESVTRGERFTFVSDGVVEAENAQHELFGFDRTRDISGKSAQEITEAAKAWGQTDDITVVTVKRASCDS